MHFAELDCVTIRAEGRTRAPVHHLVWTGYGSAPSICGLHRLLSRYDFDGGGPDQYTAGIRSARPRLGREQTPDLPRDPASRGDSIHFLGHENRGYHDN